MTDDMFANTLQQRLASIEHISPGKGENETGRVLLDEISESMGGADSLADTFVKFGDSQS